MMLVTMTIQDIDKPYLIKRYADSIVVDNDTVILKTNPALTVYGNHPGNITAFCPVSRIEVDSITES